MRPRRCPGTPRAPTGRPAPSPRCWIAADTNIIDNSSNNSNNHNNINTIVTILTNILMIFMLIIAFCAVLDRGRSWLLMVLVGRNWRRRGMR